MLIAADCIGLPQCTFGLGRHCTTNILLGCKLAQRSTITGDPSMPDTPYLSAAFTFTSNLGVTLL